MKNQTLAEKMAAILNILGHEARTADGRLIVARKGRPGTTLRFRFPETQGDLGALAVILPDGHVSYEESFPIPFLNDPADVARVVLNILA